jgi:hypothetical protein
MWMPSPVISRFPMLPFVSGARDAALGRGDANRPVRGAITTDARSGPLQAANILTAAASMDC